MSSFRRPSRPRDQTYVSWISCIGRQVLYHCCHLGRTPVSICIILYHYYIISINLHITIKVGTYGNKYASLNQCTECVGKVVCLFFLRYFLKPQLPKANVYKRLNYFSEVDCPLFIWKTSVPFSLPILPPLASGLKEQEKSMKPLSKSNEVKSKGEKRDWERAQVTDQRRQGGGSGGDAGMVVLRTEGLLRAGKSNTAM